MASSMECATEIMKALVATGRFWTDPNLDAKKSGEWLGTMYKEIYKAVANPNA